MSVDIAKCWRQLQRVGRSRKFLVTVEISLISYTVPGLFLLPVYMAPLSFPVVLRHRTMSDNIGTSPVPMSRAWPKMWE
jgi:hypothetical protein